MAVAVEAPRRDRTRRGALQALEDSKWDRAAMIERARNPRRRVAQQDRAHAWRGALDDFERAQRSAWSPPQPQINVHTTDGRVFAAVAAEVRAEMTGYRDSITTLGNSFQAANTAFNHYQQTWTANITLADGVRIDNLQVDGGTYAVDPITNQSTVTIQTTAPTFTSGTAASIYQYSRQMINNSGFIQTATDYGAPEVDSELAARRRAKMARERGLAVRRGRKLLMSFLDNEQLTSYARSGMFEVVGQSGTRYRLRKGRTILELSACGDVVASLCVHLQHKYIDEDNLIAQMMLLEHDEEGIRALANITAYAPGIARGLPAYRPSDGGVLLRAA